MRAHARARVWECGCVRACVRACVRVCGYMHIHLCVQHSEQSDVMHIAIQKCLWRLSRRRYAHCHTEVPMAIIKEKKQSVNSLDPLLVVSVARLKARKQVESTAQHFHSDESKLQRINSSAQFKMVSMRSKKPVCAPPRL